MNKKEVLLGKTFSELEQLVVMLGMPAYTARQLSDWIYKKKVRSIEDMSNLSLANRRKLQNQYTIGESKPIHMERSVDGTVKYLFKLRNGHFIETVYIPDNDRATLCVSSQVGCKMNCSFCMTGKQGFTSNLTVNEIINQIWSIPESDKLTNIVFMGMGEPMDNLNAVFNSINILTSDYGYGWSPKRITVSTIGLIPQLKKFLDESECHLAISIHSPFSNERQSLMPVEKAYPIKKIIDLLKGYDFSHQRRLSFEYIMFKDINDDLAHSKELASLLKGIHCRVNLIRFHKIPEINLESSKSESMISFRDYLTSKGIICTIRTSRGEDISAACGMLSTKEKLNENINDLF